MYAGRAAPEVLQRVRMRRIQSPRGLGPLLEACSQTPPGVTAALLHVLCCTGGAALSCTVDDRMQRRAQVNRNS